MTPTLDDNYLPAKFVCQRYRITDRTLDRWLCNPEISMPRPAYINKRRYFREAELIEWERKRVSNRAA